MKRFFTSLCVSFVILFIFSMLPFEGECRSISNNVFRVHILANSDSYEDQQLKLKVRDSILARSQSLFSSVHSKDDAKSITEEKLDYFARIAYETVRSNGYDYSVSAQVANVCFDTRYYDDITMPGGYYDALQIKIGKAEGKNWWCVIYPALCVGSASDNDNLEDKLTAEQYNIVSSDKKYVFKFKIVEIFNSVLEFFR